TDRYAAGKPGDDSSEHLLIKVVDRSGKRVPANVSVKALIGGIGPFSGVSKDESVDLNDILGFKVPRMCPAPKYVITAEYKGKSVAQEVKVGAVAEELVVLRLK